DRTALLELGQVLARLGLDDDDHEPFLASLMGIPLPPSQRRRMEHLEGEALEKLILKATGDLLRTAAADRPLVLVFEDLHWADQSTIGLLCDLVPLTETLPILLVVVCRPRFPDTSDRFLRHVAEECEARLTRIELQPLDAVASERLIDNLLADGDVPARLREVIEIKAAGNPFFIGEVVRILIDQGALAFRGRRLVALRPVEAIEIPGTVQEVVMARIDRLELRAKRMLQVVSVAGGATPHEILEEIVSDGHFESDLARLIELEFLEIHEQAGQQVYPFKHPLIQEVCYEGILLATRRDLHLRTAVALESEVPETTPGFHGMLAYHFGRGNDLESAEEYLFKAGDDAARAAASSEALHYFQEASRIYLELHGEDADPEKVASLETKIALANYHRGRQLEAIDHINRALELRGIPIPKGRGPLLRRTAGGIAVVLSKLYLPFLQRRLPSATDRDREVADLMFKRARSQTTTDPLRFLSDTIEAMRFNTTVDPATVPGAAGMYAGSAGLFAFSGVFGVSRRFLEEARRQLDGDVVGEAFLLRFFEFVHAFLEGPDVAGVPEIDPELLERNVREGGLWDVCMYLGMLIKKKVYQGAFSEATEWIEYLGKLDVLYAYRVARENYQGGEAFLAVETGRYDDGIVAAERYFAENREVLPNLLALATRGKAEALAGRLDAAGETLARADRLVASQTRIPPMHLSAHHRTHLIVEVAAIAAALAKGNGSEARAQQKAARASAKRALGTARSVAWRKPEVLRLIARLESLTGHHRRALDFLTRAIESAEGAGLRPELARAHLAAAQLLAKGGRISGRESAEHRKRGEALLDELDLSHELELGEIWTAG
ncbi:MAG: hypothetical protein GY946_09540, partial [bacterium]|nr:hypothetical protein [bacterium]